MSGALLGFVWRRHRWSLLLSLLVPVVIGTIIGLIWPSLRGRTQVLEALPWAKEWLANSTGMDPTDPNSVFALSFQHPLVLILYAVLPAIPLLALPAGERGRGGLDLILATSVERAALVRTLAVFALLLAPGVVVAPILGSLCGAAISGDVDRLVLARYPLAGLWGASLMLVYAGASLVVSVTAPDRSAANVRYGVLVVVFFALDSAARLAPRSASWLRWFTPYGYFRPTDAIGGASWLPTTAGLALCGLVLVLLAQLLESRRRAA